MKVYARKIDTRRIKPPWTKIAKYETQFEIEYNGNLDLVWLDDRKDYKILEQKDDGTFYLDINDNMFVPETYVEEEPKKKNPKRKYGAKKKTKKIKKDTE